MTSTPAPIDRYHLLLTLDGTPAMHGWWASDPVARTKARQSVGEYGRPGVRVTLTDELTGTVLTEWPARGEV
ncbi:hypothetical protein ACFWN1_14620 [Streptomyces sp. NPDC058459]|uniref:hypothetical protein n=1 Tax=Streptomyces sp. NPDC058459 TaxID=3346508 RepID=UPI00364BF72C